MSPIVEDIPPTQSHPRDLTSIPINRADLPTFFDRGWQQDKAFFCNECGNPSYQEVADERRRGCKTCGYITYYPDKHFRTAPKEAAA